MPYSTATPAAGLAFDTIAEQYDSIFTETLIGRAQRGAVWNVLRETFCASDRVLELNCGTGEDAVFLAKHGISVFACDASQRMVVVASARAAGEGLESRICIAHCATERIGDLQDMGPFDGVFSNFSGLNCVQDLQQVACDLGMLVKPKGKLLLCLSSRVCFGELLWYLGRGDLGRAFRRWRGTSTASLGGVSVSVHYPTARQIAAYFRPMFRLIGCTGIGVAVPPSYAEGFARNHPKFLVNLQALDRVICRWPMLRHLGDHTLFALQRTSA